MPNQTKIGATIGPACADVKTLVKMIKAGLNFARLNFSHGSYENMHVLIKNIRQAEKITGHPVAIMQDLSGPKLRIGELPEAGVKIKIGQEIVLDTSLAKLKGENIPLAYPDLQLHLEADQRVLIDDGRIELKIKQITGTKIICAVVEGSLIKTHKGLNLPDSRLDLSALTDKDLLDLHFGISEGVDVVAMSFVRNAKDMMDLRWKIKEFERDLLKIRDFNIQIIAKIERHEAVNNFEEILEASDGIMVARGDLGLEVPAAQVPLAQKKMIDLCNRRAKPVIVATQLLDSMRDNRRPTRAEVSDVSNAVIDHADALLLTNETAAGKYPVLTVKTMAQIIKETEKSSYDDLPLSFARKKGLRVHTAISELARVLSEEIGAKLILAASLSGETGRLISHVRPELPILVATADESVRRQLNISWGIRPFFLEQCHSIEELIDRSIMYIKKNKIAKKGDLMVLVAGQPVGTAGNVNLVEVREVV